MLGERYTIPEPVRKLRMFLSKKNALYIPCQYFFKVLQINYGVQNSFQWLFLPVSFSFVILPTSTLADFEKMSGFSSENTTI